MQTETKQTPRTRHFYALFSPRGIDVAYNDHNVAWVHGFTSRAERDRWMEDEYDPFNPQREPCSPREAKRHGLIFIENYGEDGFDWELAKFADANGIFWH